jgi:hypothetical protein
VCIVIQYLFMALNYYLGNNLNLKAFIDIES